MASDHSFFSFMAGMAAGATIALLTCTERGHEVLQELKAKGSDFFKSTKDGEDEFDEDVCQSED